MHTVPPMLARGSALLLCLILVSCGGKDEPAAGASTHDGGAKTPATETPAQGTPAQETPAAGEKTDGLPDATPITEEEMKNYVGVLTDLVASGMSLEPASETRADLVRVVDRITAEGKTGEILAKHHFDDLAHFKRVHAAVAAAYAAAAWGEVDDEFGKKEMEELEAMREHLTDAQYQEARSQLEHARELNQRYATDAGPNGKLVKEYLARLETLYD